jgi:predicted Co/Zn/Cd cation transporter (cation efflux family)
MFVTKHGKQSCHKYIGKAGSPAFIKAVEMMIRRTKIESLQQVRHTLELGLLDLIEEATRDEK